MRPDSFIGYSGHSLGCEESEEAMNEKHKGGRPRIDINLEELRKLCELHCTDEEIASWLGVSLRTITDRKQDDDEFLRVYKKGFADGKMSLRRLQWTSAEKGNITMQIWLGKQLLGQADKHEIEPGDKMLGLADIVKKALGK